jgi:outer membrane protein assembly factor BamA
MLRKILLLLLLAVPLYADEPAFFLERIEVRNQERVSPEVVIAESRLRAGQQYSEAELRDAAVRLARLPFLLSVDFSLEKGSERGRYILVLTVN